MSQGRDIVRFLGATLLLAAAVVVALWKGGYPSLRVTGTAVSSADSMPLAGVPIGTWVVGQPVARYRAMTDTQGRFLLRVPLLERVVVEVGGDCHDPVADTFRALGLTRHLGEMPLVRRPGGRPAEHVVCPSSAEEDRAHRPLLAAVLSSAPVQRWIATWAPAESVSLATTELEWGTTLAAGGRTFPVVEPASFGVMLPPDGSSLLDLYVHRKDGLGACVLLRGFRADGGARPEDLVVTGVYVGERWTLQRSGGWPGCG